MTFITFPSLFLLSLAHSHTNLFVFFLTSSSWSHSFLALFSPVAGCSLHWQLFLKKPSRFHSVPLCSPLSVNHVSSACSVSPAVLFPTRLFLHFVPDVILPFPSFFEVHRRAPPAHHYLSTFLPLPTTLPLFLRNKEWSRSSLHFFHLSLPILSRFVLHAVTLPPTPPTHHPSLSSDVWSQAGSENLRLFSSWEVPWFLLREAESMSFRCVHMFLGEGSREWNTDTVLWSLWGFLALL